MGMFDEFKLEKPIKCKKCKEPQNIVQTKKLESLMEYYKIGDVVNFYGQQQNYSTIIEDTIYCNSCKLERKVYLVIFKGIYVDSTKTLKKAEEKLKGFKQKDLLKMYYELNIKNKKLKTKYNEIRVLFNKYNDIKTKEIDSKILSMLYREVEGLDDKGFIEKINKMLKEKEK